MSFLKFVGIGLMTIISFTSFCAKWSETSISLLRGHHTSEFLAEDRASSELSFQHVSGWDYGDNFIWLDWFDYLKSSNASIESSLYGEWSPRLSIGKVLGFYSKNSFVQDILLSGTLEFGRSAFGRSRGHLYGLALDLNIKGFDFFQYNIYHRDNPDIIGTTFQSTIAYRARYQLTSKLKITWAAYIDIVHGQEGTVRDHWHTGQQLLLDIGMLLGKRTNVFYAGIEFQYWSTKFGITEFRDEKNLKYMMTWIL